MQRSWSNMKTFMKFKPYCGEINEENTTFLIGGGFALIFVASKQYFSLVPTFARIMSRASNLIILLIMLPFFMDIRSMQSCETKNTLKECREDQITCV